ncbi:MAG: hypothetical protein ACO1HD_04760 [Bacteroidota bacterium]
MARGPGKGKTNNPKGRPPGIQNERTKQWEELGKALLERHAERANEVLNNLDDDKFIDQFSKLLEYFKPKLARSEVKTNHGPVTIKVVREGNSYKPTDTASESGADTAEPQAV